MSTVPANNENHPGGKHWTPVRERLLLLTLAAIQFTTTLDFLIIMPLGPQYMRVFHVNPRQFGLIVSSYGISAGISGLTAGFFLDKFDRKWALIWLYLGFTLGTLLCGLAPTYHLLVASRFAAGAFGGVVGAVILAIIGDVVPGPRRGAAMGLVMSSFSVASIVGIPLGLWLADDSGHLSLFGFSGWHLPFIALAVLSALILVGAAFVTPALRGHMEHAREEHPVARTLAVMLHPDHQKAFVFMAALTFAGFCVFPDIPLYMVANVGVKEDQVFWIYLCGGLCTLFSMNWVGRWADRSGKLKVFIITSLTTTVPILALTNLPRVPLSVAVGTSTLLMICMSSRFVPAMAMITATVEARYRGGFMSINSAVQQLSMGLASFVTGQILGKNAQGEVTRFPINGLLSLACVYSCIYLARFLKPAPMGEEAVDEIVMETL
jgi:predicted MFS family arabinose efflux permease